MTAGHRSKHAVSNIVNYKARLNAVLHGTGIVFHAVQFNITLSTVATNCYTTWLLKRLRELMFLRGSTYNSGSAEGLL
jgi:hypothetical protein